MNTHLTQIVEQLKEARDRLSLVKELVGDTQRYITSVDEAQTLIREMDSVRQYYAAVVGEIGEAYPHLVATILYPDGNYSSSFKR